MPRRDSIIPTSNRVVQLLNNWLEKCNLINFKKNDSVLRYFDVNTSDEELVNCILTALEDESYHYKYLENICLNLFRLYRTKFNKFKLLFLNCLPCLVYLQLTKTSKDIVKAKASFYEKKSFDQSFKKYNSVDFDFYENSEFKSNSDEAKKNIYNSIDVLILSIYNMEVISQNGTPVVKSIKVPSLTKPSIYHESNLLSINDFTLNNSDTINLFGPYYEHDRINSSNRMQILETLFEIYNQHLTSLVIESFISTCNLAINILNNENQIKNDNLIKKLVNNNKANFDFQNITSKRISLSPKLLIQILNSIYFSIFNGVADLGLKALNLIHKKSIDLMYLDVLLMTNSILNSTSSLTDTIKTNDLMGINVILSPTIKSQTSKTAITNASFKTQIMPEDIPIVTKQTSSEKK